MSFNEFTPNFIQSMFFKCFHVRSYVYDNTFTLEEQIGIALEKINENIEEVNNVESAIVLFEDYVLNELSKYDQKIIDEVTAILNNYINDGTIANLINQTLFGNINNSITTLTNTVNTNKNNDDNKFLEIDQSIIDLNYKEGSCVMSIAPNQIIYNNGETINGVMINLNITKGTNDIISVKYYKNGTLINTKTSNILLSESYLDGNIINNDTEYYCEINDNKTTTQSNKININFINNFYYGVADDNTIINESFIKSLNSIKSIKDNIEQSYTVNEQKILFCYPLSYGELSNIIDNVGDDIKDCFTKYIITLSLNNVNTDYNIYSSNNLLTDNLTLKFNF